MVSRSPPMTKLSVLCWQDIPTLIEGRDEDGVQKIELSKRFSELVDMVAMRKGLVGTDEYLQNWKRKRLPASDIPAKQSVHSLAQEFEERFEKIKSDALASLK